ncbi:MAG TPA: glycine cleavage system protein GcvH [Candidatus Sulfotelmatobacter sp.]|nr:glycine cleavage system protein GcvH [Candidatus Sulfotelmatobacter sp.]
MSDPDLSKYRFTTSHEWVATESGVATIGITDYAQSQLGDIVFVELPAVGATLEAGARFGTVESVKAASDLYTPVGGRVAAVNEALTDAPEKVNEDAYGAGWMIRLEDVDESGSSLLDLAGYEELVKDAE